MRTILVSLIGLMAWWGAAHAQPLPKTQMLDPKTILFSMPTLSSDMPELEPASRQPGTTDFIFHEDEWAQIEFLPKSRLAEVQRTLKEYTLFEQTHRVAQGWREVYLRRLERSPVIVGSQSVQQLETALAVPAGKAPMLFSSNTVSGSVKQGFSLPLGGGVTLYGFADGQGIPVLGSHIGERADGARLTNAFTQLSASHGLILVDWRSQRVLVSVAASGQIEVWRP